MMELEHKTNFLVAEGGQVSVVQFADFCAINGELSMVGFVQGADDMEQGGLACARSTYDAYDFALGDVEVDAFENLKVAVGFMYAGCLNHTCQIWLQK